MTEWLRRDLVSKKQDVDRSIEYLLEAMRLAKFGGANHVGAYLATQVRLSDSLGRLIANYDLDNSTRAQ